MSCDFGGKEAVFFGQELDHSAVIVCISHACLDV